MTAKLRSLDAEPIGPSVVERLEDALERARAGEISSVGLSVVYRDGSTGQSWSDAQSIGLLLASASRLVHKLHQRLDE